MSPSVYPHPVAASDFIIYRGLCACTVCEFGSNIRPITFGWVAMGSAVLFILRSSSYIPQGLE